MDDLISPAQIDRRTGPRLSTTPLNCYSGGREPGFSHERGGTLVTIITVIVLCICAALLMNNKRWR